MTDYTIDMRDVRFNLYEFLDMEGAWADYLRATDKPVDYFMRDAVHGNDRGRQPVGRMLVKFFSPKK